MHLWPEPKLFLEWSDKEVVERWHQLFSSTPTSQRFAFGVKLGEAELGLLNKDIALGWKQLMDIFWFMRVVNESIARRANSIAIVCNPKYTFTAFLGKITYLDTHY